MATSRSTGSGSGGCWRGTADDKVASRWRGKIRAAFADPAAPDRLHAVESLAKLGYKAVGADWELLAAALGDANGSMAAYAAWVLGTRATRGRAAAGRIAAKRRRPVARAAAAYAVRHLPAPSPLLRRQLLEAADREPAGSDAHGQLVCAAAVVASRECKTAGGKRARRAGPRRLARRALPGLRRSGGLARPATCRCLSLLTRPRRGRGCGAARAVLRLERRCPIFWAGSIGR